MPLCKIEDGKASPKMYLVSSQIREEMLLPATFLLLFVSPSDILDFKMRRGVSLSPPLSPILSLSLPPPLCLSPYATWDASKMDGASPPSPRERHRQGAKVGASARMALGPSFFARASLSKEAQKWAYSVMRMPQSPNFA